MRVKGTQNIVKELMKFVKMYETKIIVVESYVGLTCKERLNKITTVCPQCNLLHLKTMYNNIKQSTPTLYHSGSGFVQA